MTDAFWATRPALQHVLTLARARGAGPWAVLGAAMARAVASIPPYVVLPGVVGGRMSLNLFIALVGPSGGGKGAAMATAMEGYKFGYIETVPLGSGEGIARTYRPVGTKPDQANVLTAAVFDAPEIDTAAALSNRQGSTLFAELRKMFSGEQLGFGNAGKDTRNVVAAGSYRACVTVGVQPLRSHTLLGASDGGLPQRFVWMPTSDPDAPDEPPAEPDQWKTSRPAWLCAVDSHIEIVIPDVARQAIRNHRLAVLREEPNVDPLDGHALLTRLKVAVGLMALEGRTVVSEEDWKLAGFVMDVSTYTRERCQRALENQSRSANRARALAAADRDEIITDRKLQRCREAITRWLTKADGEPVTRRELTQKIKSDVREYFDTAIAEMLEDNRISPVETSRGTAFRSNVGHEVQRTSPAETHVGPRSNVGPIQKPARRRRGRTRGKNRQPQQTGEQAS